MHLNEAGQQRRHAKNEADMLTKAAPTDACTTPIALWALHKLVVVLGPLATQRTPFAGPATHVTCRRIGCQMSDLLEQYSCTAPTQHVPAPLGCSHVTELRASAVMP